MGAWGSEGGPLLRGRAAPTHPRPPIRAPSSPLPCPRTGANGACWKSPPRGCYGGACRGTPGSAGGGGTLATRGVGPAATGPMGAAPTWSSGAQRGTAGRAPRPADSGRHKAPRGHRGRRVALGAKSRKEGRRGVRGVEQGGGGTPAGGGCPCIAGCLWRRAAPEVGISLTAEQRRRQPLSTTGVKMRDQGGGGMWCEAMTFAGPWLPRNTNGTARRTAPPMWSAWTGGAASSRPWAVCIPTLAPSAGRGPRQAA